MKKLLTVLTVAFIAFTSFGQEDYTDLLMLKADQDWEKLIKKADSYTSKDKTKNDPLPYYYLAYGLYQISFIGDRPEEFKNAFKDAITVVGKMQRKDSDRAVQNEYAEFFSELKGALFETIRNEMDAGEYKRAFGWVMKVYKFGRDDVGGKFLEGACRFNNGDKSSASTAWSDARKTIEENPSISSEWSDVDKEMIMYGMYESAKALMASNQNDAAKDIMNLGGQWFDQDEKWQDYYDKIIN